MNFFHLLIKSLLKDSSTKRRDKASCCKPNDYLIVPGVAEELAITCTRRPMFSDYMFARSP